MDNIQAACKRIEDAGYPFQKKLTDGRMRQIAFAKDPDGYWVEIIGQRPLEETEGVNTTETSSYSFNHSIIRFKSAVSGHTRIAQRSLSLNTHLSPVLYMAESRLTGNKTRAWTETWLH